MVLVGNGGIVKAVTDHRLSPPQGGQDQLFQMLHPIREKKEQFGVSGQSVVRGMQENFADVPPYFGSSRLAGFHDRVAGGADFFRQQGGLSGFAAPVDALEGNERTAQ